MASNQARGNRINTFPFQLPLQGFGTKTDTNPEALEFALNSGLTLIDGKDSNQSWENFQPILLKFDRSKLLICSKVEIDSCQNAHSIIQSLHSFLSRSGLAYVDVYYVHTCYDNYPSPDSISSDPGMDFLAVWEVMESLVDSGLIRYLGVSNITNSKLLTLLRFCRIRPSFLQNEFHPFCQDMGISTLCEKESIIRIAHSPFGSRMQRAEIVNHPIISKAVSVYQLTPEQIILCWHIRLGWIPIPSSNNVNHIKINVDLLHKLNTISDIRIDLASMNKDIRSFDKHGNQHNIQFYYGSHKARAQRQTLLRKRSKEFVRRMTMWPAIIEEMKTKEVAYSIIEKTGVTALQPLSTRQTEQFFTIFKEARLRKPSFIKPPFLYMYELEPEYLFQHPELLHFGLSLSILLTISIYLGTIPRLCRVMFWDSLPCMEDEPGNPTNECQNDFNLRQSQLWHLDLEDMRKIMVVINLTDTAERNGPLRYLDGEHSDRLIQWLEKTNLKYYNNIPPGDFNWRMSEEELQQFCLEDSHNSPFIQSFLGGAGSCIMIDTARLIHCGSQYSSEHIDSKLEGKKCLVFEYVSYGAINMSDSKCPYAALTEHNEFSNLLHIQKLFLGEIA